ncbi:ATP-binding protein [Bacillus infantis]|uniref:ATP-binding protein n=1 Tax=Bacillus infantis TaxID=324767 RepID=UPI00209CD835|nr:ATP-binding protein [Bacillus infantis]MCP1156423.1 ATP-binding protein [Bacillus infantis]
MRDVLYIPGGNGETLVISSDNSGGIGLKEADHVKVPYETVAYFAFRTAVMENLSAGGAPFAAVLHNFAGEEHWNALAGGIENGAQEAGIEGLAVTGSTESNFDLLQSAVGLIVIGKKTGSPEGPPLYTGREKLAVIGLPLVGEEVLSKNEAIAPLSLFKEISRMDGIHTLPVGSKGILYELNQLFSNREFTGGEVSCKGVDLLKSGGPSCCFIASYSRELEQEILVKAGSFHHQLEIN